jgi:uncharacterized protein (TIGR03067 family)
MTDQEQMQGTWRLVSGRRNGKSFPEETVKTIRLVFAGDQLTTKVGDRGTKFAFMLDPEQEPKAIDLDMDGSVGKGIYQLDEDKLRIVHGEVGTPRPKDFSAQEGSGLVMLTLQREPS